jgi:hypothetical protein
MRIHERPAEQRAAFEKIQRDDAAAFGIRAGARYGEAFRLIDDV